MKQFAKKLHLQMVQELEMVNHSVNEEPARSKAYCEVVQTTMALLKQFVKEYSFSNTQEEIHFFKVIKPNFHKEMIYRIEIGKIETGRPRCCSRELLIGYYQHLGEHIRTYFQQQHTLYLYHKTNRSTEDELLFIRNAECVPFLPEDCIDMDCEFTTLASSHLAKIMAYEMLIEYLEDKIAELERPALPIDPAQYHANWTSTKADLIELAYALHANGCINGGRAEIQEIIGILETVFKTKLGNFYRTFQSMRLRKKNRSAFLDVLRDSLIKKMDDADRL